MSLCKSSNWLKGTFPQEMDYVGGTSIVFVGAMPNCPFNHFPCKKPKILKDSYKTIEN